MDVINIVLDEKDPQNPIFVEIENSQGKSVNIGERTVKDGLTYIKITPVDLAYGNNTLSRKETEHYEYMCHANDVLI